MMSFSPAHIWASMGPLSKVIAAFLLAMATASIAVTIERLITMWRGNVHTRRFMKGAIRLIEAGDYTEAAKLARLHKPSPFARLIAPVLDKMNDSDDGKLSLVERATREAERQKEAVGSDLRRGLGVLASVGSIAPFVGLLGTVVGIITAFQGIASTGSGGLGAVSAGIAEALVETALGLMVAIPAVLFFNALTTRTNGIDANLARLTSELLDELENKHGLRASGQYEAAA